MTIQDCARLAKTEGFQLIRYRKDSLTQTGIAEYDCKPGFTGSKRGWVLLDSFTAGAIVAVFDALNEENKAKFHKIPARPTRSVLPKTRKDWGLACESQTQ